MPDLKNDERFSEYPNVVGEPHYRFYCGMPLINPEGYALGMLKTRVGEGAVAGAEIVTPGAGQGVHLRRSRA